MSRPEDYAGPLHHDPERPKPQPMRTRVEAAHAIADALDRQAWILQRRRSVAARHNYALAVFLDRRVVDMSRILAKRRRRLRRLNGVEPSERERQE